MEGKGGGVLIVLFSEVTPFEDNVSTIVSLTISSAQTFYHFQPDKSLLTSVSERFSPLGVMSQKLVVGCFDRCR